MGPRIRGLLLFSFVFSSVLSSPEVPITPNGKRAPLSPTAVESSNSNTSINPGINIGCFKEGSCSGVESIQKRETGYSSMNKGELKKAVDLSESGGGNPYPGYVHMNNGIEKRARVGFTGMRGKKDSYLSHNYADKGTPPGEEDLETFLDILEKRTRMGFNGMRGKKYQGSDKRGQILDFHGLRGTKLDDYDGYIEKVRGLSELIPWHEIRNEEFSDEEIPTSEKRTMAFHGMRGRRSENPVFVKRYPFPSYEMMQDNNGYSFKRTMGFLGMRGKKTPESWNWDGNYGKRGIQSGFFGMKGKKAQSGFFGMRGKKSLSDVPGISGDSESLVNTISLINNSDSSQERFRRAGKVLKNSKKAKSAFFAVRGKKSFDNESEPSFVASLE